MKRRNFIKTAGMTFGTPFLLNGMGISALPNSFFNINNNSDRVLVLIQLSGGNDGLNTIIPLDQYRNLNNARPNIIIPESKIIRATDTNGFHPSMTGMKALYDEGKLEIIQSVGYPNQNRSHFRSTEIWATGSSSTDILHTGWLGRYMDEQYPGFPDAYPDEQNPDPFAIAMGYFVSETCQGKAANFSVVLNDPFSFKTLPYEDEAEEYGSYFKEELAFVQLMYSQTNSYVDQVVAATENGTNLGTYPDTLLANQLKNVALMISGGLKTSVYVVTLGGFDTHANQVVGGNTVAGVHADLLKTLSDAVKAFQNDLKSQGLEKRVLGMTFSEFGRQIRSNSGAGTDHGSAAPLILFGSCVNAQILGQNPVIPDNVPAQAGVNMQYDFRDVYGSVLMDWFGAEEQHIKKLLYDSFQYLPIVSKCNLSTSTDMLGNEAAVDVLKSYPNPFSDWTTVFFRSGNEQIQLSVVDTLGKEVAVLVNKRLGAGEHQIRWESGNLPTGTYYLRLLSENAQHTKPVVKIK